MQHFTRNTESMAAWCNKCKGQTQHKVFNGVLSKSNCIPCCEKLEKQHAEKLAAAPAPQLTMDFAH